MTTYTSTAEVRKDAGFTGNSYILDATIDVIRARAFGRINTVVASRYLLPISGVAATGYLAQIEILLACGHLLWNEYGKEAIGTDKDGQEKIRMWEAMLGEILSGKVKLFGDDGVELPGPAAWSTKSGLPQGEVDEYEPYFTRDTSDI